MGHERGVRTVKHETAGCPTKKTMSTASTVPQWLLDKVADTTGVKDDLLKVLDGNHEMVNDILTMAYFPFVDNLSYNQLSQ